MLQIANLDEYTEKDISGLLELVRPVLAKRARLHEKYSRCANQNTLMYSSNNESTKLPFEKYITDLATGYLSGDPTYSVELNNNEDRNRIVEQLLDRKPGDADYRKGMEVIIDYISKYNDDATEHHDLVHDILELTSCYEVIYENENNEIVYSKYSPLQTVATWDYCIPANLTGLIRVWDEKNLYGNIITKVELTDKNGTRVYTQNGKEVFEDYRENHNWGDVPAICVETDYSIFETCEDAIAAYEQLVQNMRNTYQYNDSDCKLIITGYSPENAATTLDDDGNVIPNPARAIEDNIWIKARTVYTGENGKIEWLSKPVDSNGVATTLKIYADLMFQLAGIPNTSDLAFNSSDLNASAIDRKFYVMNMMTEDVINQLKKAYLRRWELIFNRINIKKSTNFDFRDIVIELPKNLPSNNVEVQDSMLKLKGLISNQTIIEKLGYNYISEKEKMDEESADNMLQNLELMKNLGEEDEQSGNNQQKMEEDGQDTSSNAEED